LTEDVKPSLWNTALEKLGLKTNNLVAMVKEKEAPSVFSYSLYFVYYDQYTFISGVLA
jgi:hypothetical protein